MNHLQAEQKSASDGSALLNSSPDRDHGVARDHDNLKMRPVFIGGCARSGTTLLGSMLGTHSKCLATPESKFNIAVCRLGVHNNADIDMATILRTVSEQWSFKLWDLDIQKTITSDEKRWARYSDFMNYVVREYGNKANKPDPAIWVDHTPDNIIFAPHLFALFPEARMIHLIRDGRATAASVMKLDWGPNTISSAANAWINRVAHGLAIESRYGRQRVMQVRYEELVLTGC